MAILTMGYIYYAQVTQLLSNLTSTQEKAASEEKAAQAGQGSVGAMTSGAGQRSEIQNANGPQS